MPLTKAEFSRLRDLRDKKHREAAGLFVIEGEKVIRELLSANFPLLEIYATTEWTSTSRSDPDVGGVPSLSAKALATAEPREASSANGPTSGVRAPRPPTHLITADEMARASHYPTPSSVLAIGRITRAPLAVGALNQGLTLALDGIQDPGNVGTLLRIADWFAFDRVLLSPDCADLFSQKVINASMGSFSRVKTFTAPLLETLATTSVPILGCDLEGVDVHTLQPLRDAVVVMGNEGRGLSASVQALVTQRVTIPKYGGAESLNAAIAAAIVCDNLRRLIGR